MYWGYILRTPGVSRQRGLGENIDVRDYLSRGTKPEPESEGSQWPSCIGSVLVTVVTNLRPNPLASKP